MEKFFNLLQIVYPTFAIPQRYKNAWEQRDREGFKLAASFYFVFFILAYLLHFYFIDIPLKKQPLSDWRFYRFSCAGIAFISLLATYNKHLFSSRLYRVPVIISGLYFTFFQAQSMVWREAIPYYYLIALPAITSFIASPSLLGSILFMICSYLVGQHGIDARPDHQQEILSAYIVSIVFLVSVKSSYKAKVKAFISDMKSIEIEKQKISIMMEMKEQMRTFLPTEIYRRYEANIKLKKMSNLQAIDDVLQQKEKVVAILHSDIRGYTKLTKNPHLYIKNIITPDIQNSAKVVDQNQGIPRIVGDQTFAYFDNDEPYVNIKNALLSGVEILSYSIEKSQIQEVSINRYVIISFGPGLTGNLGGAERYRDISVQGPAANICSRIDTLTKEESFQEACSYKDIVLTQNAYDEILKHNIGLDIEKIKLVDLGLEIRDFEEHKLLFKLPLSEKNKSLIFSLKNLPSANSQDTISENVIKVDFSNKPKEINKKAA